MRIRLGSMFLAILFVLTAPCATMLVRAEGPGEHQIVMEAEEGYAASAVAKKASYEPEGTVDKVEEPVVTEGAHWLSVSAFKETEGTWSFLVTPKTGLSEAVYKGTVRMDVVDEEDVKGHTEVYYVTFTVKKASEPEETGKTEEEENASNAVNTRPQTVTVTFDKNDGSPEETRVEKEIISKGTRVLEPEKPERDGYWFVNWFEGEKTTPFDFETGIDTDITLKAVWAERVAPEKADPVLAEIKVTTPPDKTEYADGETLDVTGMVVTAVYEDGTTRVLSPGEYTVAPSKGTSLGMTDNTILITYTEKDVTKQTGQSISVHPILIDTTTIPDGVAGEAYDVSLGYKGYATWVKWSIAEGKLPEGLTLTEDGKITGTPAGAGEYTFTVEVENDHGDKAQMKFTIKIAEAEKKEVKSASATGGETTTGGTTGGTKSGSSTTTVVVNPVVTTATAPAAATPAAAPQQNASATGQAVAGAVRGSDQTAMVLGATRADGQQGQSIRNYQTGDRFSVRLHMMILLCASAVAAALLKAGNPEGVFDAKVTGRKKTKRVQRAR